MFQHREKRMYRRDGGASEYGFTLIELLIVIVVLGILAAIVVFSLTGITGQSQAAACTTNGKTVEVAADAYQARTGNWPTSTGSLVGPYLHAWPTGTAYTMSLGSTTVNVQIGTAPAVAYTATNGCASL